MPKRFTETNKWTNNKWFFSLSIESKLFWIFLLDSCDSVGVWEENILLANNIIGYEYSMDTLLKDFGKQIHIFKDNRKWWIRDFCDFQYGILKEDSASKPILSYIALLKKHSLWKLYTKGIYTLKEKEKDMDKEKDKGKEQDKEQEIFDLIRKKYPGIKRGINTEYSNLKKKHQDWKEVIKLMMPAIDNQISFRNKLNNSNKFVPSWKNFQTWINNRCWEDEMSEQIYKKVLTSQGMPKSQEQIRKEYGESKHQFLGIEDHEIKE